MEWWKSLPLNRIKKKKKRMERKEDSSRDHWDNIKCTNICIIVIPEGEEIEKGPEKIFEEIIAENFPNMGKETLTQVQEVYTVPYKINVRRNILIPILTKLTKIKDKEKILKATRERQANNIQGNLHKVIN